jgi:endothelin-converting enzyme/putative endopeptidase
VNRALPLVALAALACAAPRPPPAPPPPPVAQVTFAPPPAAPGIDPSLVKRTVEPCDDFYEFACGGWLERTTMPADQSRWVRSFNVMREENKARLRTILDAAAAGSVEPQDRYGQVLADFYAGCLDAGVVEKAGLRGLQAAWKQVDAVKDARSLATALGRLHADTIPQVGNVGVDYRPAFFGVGSIQDAKDSTLVIGGLAQGGLSLPDRDYYLKQDEKSVTLRQDFLAHLAKQLAAAGEPARQAAAEAKEILALETALAESHWTRVELRDPERTYNRLELAGIKKAAPHFDWDRYLAAYGVKGLTAFTVTTPKMLTAFDRLVQKGKPAAWRAYLRWHLLRQAAAVGALPKALSEEAFWYRARHFTGEAARPERWKECADLTDGLLGQALGQAFVRRHFGGDAKPRALALVHGIQGAMGARIAALDWMDAPTREKALEKLAKVDNKIGYPESWQSYDGLVVRRDDFLGSVRAAGAFETARDLAKIGKPVDRTEWGMTTPTVNAYYNPQLNEMVFPAGILQPPFYTQGANDAVNYGAVGLVVGHELTHGFDDQGRKFDAHGNLTDWWSKPVSDEFDRRAECVVKQYSAYPVIDDVKLDGKLTLGENIADLGGLTLSYAAYRASRAGKPEEAPVGGFSADQQFFLAHAQAWCAQIRPENARLRAATDAHSSARWRVNGPLSNLGEFAAAFQCRPGAPMVRAERCNIW